MPRAFTEDEKRTIQARLLQAGRERFARYGLRKTNVEELTRDVGISKGAFYIFYASKEELYFDVMSQVESEIQSGLLEVVSRNGDGTASSFRGFLKSALSILETHPFFANTGDEDYRYLLRSMPPDRLREGIRKDEEFVARLLAAWADKGVVIDYEPTLVSALLRSLVFLSTHKGDFEPGTFPQVMDFMISSLADRLIGSPDRERAE